VDRVAGWRRRGSRHVAEETRKQTAAEAEPVVEGGPATDAGVVGAAQPGTGAGAASETRVQETISPARAKANQTAAASATGAGGAGRSGRTELIRVGDRSEGDVSRTSPRMRFDLLQIAAWAIGLALIVGGLVAVARAGFDDLGLFEPVVDVGGQPATPLLALLWLLIGAVLLAAATGSVAEQRLRIAGVVFAIVGLVFMIEPDAFAEYLGVDASSGSAMLVAGAVLIAASFVPPLSIRRPGIREDAAKR
jgi:hypothetical protein